MAIAPQKVRAFFVTSATWNRRSIFQSASMATLLCDVLQDCGKKGRFHLHEFAVMPEHFHLLITPSADVPLEKAIQYVKGGFSFRAGKELEFKGQIWQDGFSNHRIRNFEDYENHRRYIRENPVKRFLVEKAEMFLYSSANPAVNVDPAPPWLKP